MLTHNFLSRFLTSSLFAHCRARYAVRGKEQTQPTKQKHAPKKFTDQRIIKMFRKFGAMKFYKVIRGMTTIFLLVLISCSKLGYDKVQDFQETEIPCFSSSQQEFIINDDNTYYSLLDTFNCTPLKIDFSQKTLIGKFTKASGCSIKYKRQLYVNHEDKNYLYSINVKEKGWCKIDFSSMNWVIVPKIPSDYSVTFKIK